MFTNERLGCPSHRKGGAEIPGFGKLPQGLYSRISTVSLSPLSPDWEEAFYLGADTRAAFDALKAEDYS